MKNQLRRLESAVSADMNLIRSKRGIKADVKVV